MFKLNSKFSPSGDQPKAINDLVSGLRSGLKDQVLLGVTGSGKTFTMASIIQEMQKPTLIMAHNKTLAGQIYSEMKEFFPDNAVEYFISYYDYYQPEAYLPAKDVYIEKESQINEQIDIMRHSATRSLFERKDVIIVASVSAIYGLGSPENYQGMKLEVKIGDVIETQQILNDLIKLQYKRNDTALERGCFSVKGDIIEVVPPSSEDEVIRICFFGDEIEDIRIVNLITRETIQKVQKMAIYPNGHHVAPSDQIRSCVSQIMSEMHQRVEFFLEQKRYVEADRIEKRVKYDIEMMIEIGFCRGIENYSRYITNRPINSAPPTLFDYLPKDALLFVDESHVTTPQIGGMYAGDRARKETLIEHGFRLPSAFDNRPLKFEEWDFRRPQTIFVSATPGKIELEKTQGVITEQIIRPTGLLDPICEIRPATGQVDDVVVEVEKIVKKGGRVLCITLTKKYAERLHDYFKEIGVKSLYIHSDIDALERLSIIKSLREGKVDVLIGINLLREGIDIPECELVAILDADKEGFLRSETSLIQIIGRAARNVNGRVVIYADKMTKSIEKAVEATKKRRAIQEKHNLENRIVPKTVVKKLMTPFDDIFANKSNKDSESGEIDYSKMSQKELENEIKRLNKLMKESAKNLMFEEAKKCRDEVKKLQGLLMV
jgi:excinuclease ABC subunit B